MASCAKASAQGTEGPPLRARWGSAEPAGQLGKAAGSKCGVKAASHGLRGGLMSNHLGGGPQFQAQPRGLQGPAGLQ